MRTSAGAGDRSIGRALSLVGASLLIHAAILLVLALVRPAGPEAPARPPAVLLLATFTRPASEPLASEPIRAAARSAERLQARGLPVAGEVPLPAAFSALPGPAPAAGPVAAVAAPRRLAAAVGKEQPSRLRESVDPPAPDFEELLAQEPPPGIAPVEESGGAAGAAALVADERPIEWSGQPRRVLVRRDPRFPRTLIREGQEAEVTARFTVSPEGQVSNVEILRSSGDTLLETEVRQALGAWLLERSASGQSETATISFRFRLER